MTPRSGSVHALMVLGAMAAGSAALRAQETLPEPSRGGPWWGEELAVVSANVLIGGLTAGVWQGLKGGSFSDGFTRGAMGGAIGYAGKRIVTAHVPGAGLVGREVAAVGHSIVRNAAEGRGTFSRVSLPLAFLPARVYFGDWPGKAPVRLDALAGWYFVSGLAKSRASLDLGRSLSWGAAAFVTDAYIEGGDAGFPAAAPVGTIYYNRSLIGTPFGVVTAAHERVHVLQGDFVIDAWGDPGDDWLATWVPGLGTLSRFVAPNLMTFGLLIPHSWLQGHLDHAHLPWELEATALSDRVR